MTPQREGSRSTQLQRASEMYRRGISVPKAAAACNLPKQALYQWLRFTNQMQPRADRPTSPRGIDPTPEQIAERAEAIRMQWTDAERATRWVASGRNNPRLERMYACLRRAYAQGAA